MLPFRRATYPAVGPAFLVHAPESSLHRVEEEALVNRDLGGKTTYDLRPPMVETHIEFTRLMTERRHRPELDIGWSGKDLQRMLQSAQ